MYQFGGEKVRVIVNGQIYYHYKQLSFQSSVFHQLTVQLYAILSKLCYSFVINWTLLYDILKYILVEITHIKIAFRIINTSVNLSELEDIQVANYPLRGRNLVVFSELSSGPLSWRCPKKTCPRTTLHCFFFGLEGNQIQMIILQCV